MRVFIAALLGFAFSGLATAQASQYFTIKVIDGQTGRGVPLVELKTTDDTAYYTDSNGIVAFYEPGLMGQTVYFNIRSDGYEFPEDFLGNRGTALKVTSGGHAELKIRRTSIAERLYRTTGEGIYRDSVLVGAPVPVRRPLLNSQVMGQDGGLAIPWRGKIYWLFGDTAKPSYPLGNFGASGATSEWPRNGGLDPNVGVDLRYFVDETGFTRPLMPSENFPGPGPRWPGGLKIVSDDSGNEHLVADYVRVGENDTLEAGVAILNDKTDTFERLAQFDRHDTMLPACTGGQATRVRQLNADYYYQGTQPPLCRVQANLASVKDPSSYEGFSPLAPGARYDKEATKLDRDSEGHLHFGWKANTPPLTASQQEELIAAGKMTASEGFFHLRDVDTGKTVKPRTGSVEWNAFRGRWVMIVSEDEGLANHGILWFSEADTPLGPWVYAKRIFRHEKYNFYNPVQHPFFALNDAHMIFFEGTYADIFSDGAQPIPRYNYNEIMYRLDLSDPRLALPVPVYLVGRDRYLLGDELKAENAWDRAKTVPFFAVPPGYAHQDLIPIFASKSKHGTLLLSQSSSKGGNTAPLFYALPLTPPTAAPQALGGKWSCKAQIGGDSDYASLTLDLGVDGEAVRSASGAEDVQGTFQNSEVRLVLKTEDGSYDLAAELKGEKLSGTWKSLTKAAEHGTVHCERPLVKPRTESRAIVALYEYVNISDGSYLYSTNAKLPDKIWRRAAQPLCRVWGNPLSQLFLDPTAKPVPDAPGSVD